MGLSFASPRVLVAGSVNMDLSMRLRRSPEAGETVFGDGYAYIPGGKGANQAVGAARLGAAVTFCGRIGSDPAGEQLRDGLKAEGIDVSFLEADGAAPSGLAVIHVEEGGQNRITVLSGANMRVTPGDAAKALERDYDALIMQLEIPLETVAEACRMAAAKGIPVILDAGPAMRLPPERLRGSIAVISPNETEARAMTGIPVDGDDGALKAAEKIFEDFCPKAVVLKLGKRGALLYAGGKGEFVPAFEGIKAVDTTAAGDAFTAALAIGYACGGGLADAVRYANAAGGLCVSKKGAQPAMPTKDEVEWLLRGLPHGRV